jgi:hypothetical protein
MRATYIFQFCIILTTIISGCLSFTQKEVCSSQNCLLPVCRCSSINSPRNTDLSETPMMIALSFNGIINQDVMQSINKILDPSNKNPSGCPIQGTFFVSDVNKETKTEYCLVQNLFDKNNEIAVGTTIYEYFNFIKHEIAKLSLFINELINRCLVMNWSVRTGHIQQLNKASTNRDTI